MPIQIIDRKESGFNRKLASQSPRITARKPLVPPQNQQDPPCNLDGHTGNKYDNTSANHGNSRSISTPTPLQIYQVIRSAIPNSDDCCSISIYTNGVIKVAKSANVANSSAVAISILFKYMVTPNAGSYCSTISVA